MSIKNYKDGKTLEIELPFDKCSNCSIRNENLQYSGLVKDVSWGEWTSNIDVIFITDKGTNFGHIYAGGDETGDLLISIIRELNIKNWFITSSTLCRSQDGEAPSKENIFSCFNNIEVIIETIKKMNELQKKRPPIIIVLGSTAAQRFFPDIKKKDLKISTLRSEGYEYNDCPLFVTYHPASFLENETFKNLAIQDIISAFHYYLSQESTDENEYMLIENLDEFDNTMDYLMTQERLVYDIETTGNKYLIMKDYKVKKRKRNKQVFLDITDDWRQDTIIGISFSSARNTGIYLPLWIKGKNLNEFDVHRLPLLGYNDYEFSDSRFYFWLGRYNEKHVIKRIKELIENENIQKCNQNIKFDNQFLITQLDIYPKNVVWDTMNAIFLLNENVPKSLEYNVDVRYPDLRGYKQQVHGSLTKEKQEIEDYGDIPLERIWQYGARDADATFRLWEDVQKELDAEHEKALAENPNAMINNNWLMENFYKPIVDIYTRSEIEGIPFDREYASKLADEFLVLCQKFENDVNATFKETYPDGVNLNSPIQIKNLVFDTLGWPILKTKGKKQPFTIEFASTDKSTFKELHDWFQLRNQDGRYSGEIDFIKRLLTYKNQMKFIGTYLRGKKIYNRLDQNDHLHTSYLFYDFGGRFSSRPNVQNIPRNKKIRGIFKLSDPDYDLYGCDLSQAELRIMAWYANDLVMIDWINRGVDIHWEATRDVIYNSQKDLVYDEQDPKMKAMRKMLKTGNFGRLYGAATKRVMQSFRDRLEVGDKMPEQHIIDKHGTWFFETFFRIKEYLAEVEEQILRYGYIDTIFGRRRHLPDAFSPNKMKKAEAVRSGANAQIQGTCSDMTQYALIRIDDHLTKNKMKSKFLWSVHDELLFKLHKDESEYLQKYIPEEMTRLVGPVAQITSIKLEAEGTIYDQRWGTERKKDAS